MPKVNRQQSQINREKIIEAASQLFIENGYHGTSMRQIADRADAALGSIYHHFANKEELWVEVFIQRHPLQQILPLLQNVQGETAAELIHNAAFSMVTELGKHKEMVNLMMIEIVEFQGVHMSQMFSAFAPGFLEMSRLFTLKSGSFRDVSIPAMGRAFAGLFFSYYMTGWIIPEEYSPIFGEHQLDDFIDIYLHGILAG